MEPTARQPELPRIGYTVAEVAESLGLPVTTVRRLIRAGQIRAKWTGRQYVVPRSAIDEYFEGS